MRRGLRLADLFSDDAAAAIGWCESAVRMSQLSALTIVAICGRACFKKHLELQCLIRPFISGISSLLPRWSLDDKGFDTILYSRLPEATIFLHFLTTRLRLKVLVTSFLCLRCLEQFCHPWMGRFFTLLLCASVVIALRLVSPPVPCQVNSLVCRNAS